MSKNTLYYKLLLGFILIIACMILLGSIALTSIITVERGSDTIQEAYMPLISSAHKIESHVSQAIENVKDYFYFNDSKHITTAIDTLEQARTIAWDLLAFTSEHKELETFETQVQALNQNILTYTRSIDKSVFAQNELTQASKTLQDDIFAINAQLKELIIKHSAESNNKDIQDIVLIQNDMIYVLVTLTQELSGIKSKQDFDFSSLEASLNNFENMLHALQGNILLYFNTDSKESLDGIDSINSKIRKIREDILSFFENYKSFIAIINQRLEHSNKLTTNIKNVIAEVIDTTAKISEQVADDTNKATFSIILSSSLVTIFSIFIAITFANYIFNPIQKCIDYAKRVANGDFSSSLNYKKSDEVGDLVSAINKMVESLKDKIAHYKNIDLELKSKSTELHNILQILPCAINVKDLQGKYTMVNKSFLLGLNVNEEEVLGQTNIVWGSHELQNIQAIYEQAMLKSKEPVTFEHIITYYNGTEHYFISTKIPLLDHQGEVYNILTFSIEHTKEKILEQELVKSKTLSEMALVLAKAWHWHILPNEPDIYYTNSDIFKLSGEGNRKKEFLTSEEWFEDIQAYNSEQADIIHENVFKVIWGELESYDYVYKRYNPSLEKLLWFREVVKRVYDNESGELLLISGLSQDISEYKEQEIELIRSKNEAIAAAQAKSDFLANMSHEIRTPLNAITGMTYLAIQKNLDHQLENYLNNISISAKVLLELINSILDFSKIEAGKLELEKTPISVNDILHKIINIVEIEADKKELILQLHIDSKIPKLLLGDSLRLTQVILNLINNAIKFSIPHKQIKISARLVEQVENKILLLFSVQDYGIGIDKDKIATLFEAFKQADNSVTRKYGGTGLGLAISKQLVELMGGKIFAESTQGEGSLFTFTAYFDEATEQTNDYDQQIDICYDFNKSKILLAEDNLINQEIAVELLAKLNIETTLANNGQELLYILDQEYASKKFDLIFMDIQMPILDGITTTHYIRQQTKYDQLPIIAMTAHALDSDRDKSLEVGMQDHITKPIEFDVLAKTLSKWLIKE